jgi:hypothetical protein
MNIRILLAVLWPAFLVAGLATGLLFSMVDPEDIRVFGMDLEVSAMAVYTVGFFMLWGMCTMSGLLTAYVTTGLQDPLAEAGHDIRYR